VAKTKVLAVPDPVWNEKFTFEVVNPESQIRFAVFDQARSREDFEGEVIVPLKELRDQNIHDVWLDLFTRTGQKGRGQIHVKLQWIHSKVLIIYFFLKYRPSTMQWWLKSGMRITLRRMRSFRSTTDIWVHFMILSKDLKILEGTRDKRLLQPISLG
jgi:hypothetical protein